MYIIELNPPLSVLMYMPASYLGWFSPHVFVIVMMLVHFHDGWNRRGIPIEPIV